MVLDQEFEKEYKFGRRTRQNYQKNDYEKKAMMFWEIKFSTRGVVTKMEKCSVVNVNHVIIEKRCF